MEGRSYRHFLWSVVVTCSSQDGSHGYRREALARSSRTSSWSRHAFDSLYACFILALYSTHIVLVEARFVLQN